MVSVGFRAPWVHATDPPRMPRFGASCEKHHLSTTLVSGLSLYTGQSFNEVLWSAKSSLPTDRRSFFLFVRIFLPGVSEKPRLGGALEVW